MALEPTPDNCLELSEDENGDILVKQRYHPKKTHSTRTQARSKHVATKTTTSPACNSGTVSGQVSASEGNNAEVCKLVLEVASLRIQLARQEQECSNLQRLNDEMQQALVEKSEVIVTYYEALREERTKERDAALGARDTLCDILDRQASCQICLLPMCSAYTLYDCGHTFCEGCLATIEDMASRKRAASLCPNCRTAIKTPPCRNYAMEDLANIARDINRQREEHINGRASAI
ncbi:hypothetical protein PENSPDRAFT_693605 [Peniophora sp. CONT]|nr:hypothetical protein PENSPDRAFT_693605 [Peniophora sp. CONT]